MSYLNRFVLLRLWTLAWLTAVWVLLWGNISWANVLGGLAVGIGIMVFLPLPRVPVEGRIHLLSAVKLVAVFAYFAIESSVRVSWLALRPKAPPATGVLRCRVAIKSDMVLTLCVDALNLIPGTMVLEIDQTRRIVYVHVLDLGTEKAVDSFYDSVRRLEKLFIAAFERDTDWKPSPLHAEEYAQYHGVDGDDFSGTEVSGTGVSGAGKSGIGGGGSGRDERRDDKRTDDERTGDWT